MKRIGIVAVVLWAMSGGVVWPTNAGAQSSQTIYACVDSVNGNVRIVSAGAACRTNEYSTQWNIAGLTGPAGPQGPAGPAGAQGPPGPGGMLGFASGRVLAGTLVNFGSRVTISTVRINCPNTSCLVQLSYTLTALADAETALDSAVNIDGVNTAYAETYYQSSGEFWNTITGFQFGISVANGAHTFTLDALPQGTPVQLSSLGRMQAVVFATPGSKEQ